MSLHETHETGSAPAGAPAASARHPLPATSLKPRRPKRAAAVAVESPATRRAADPATVEPSRDQIVERHLPLVHHVARKIHAAAPGRAELGDLISAGTMGLINAVESYDPGRGLAFSTYAAPRIRGAILDDLRRWDHAPRSIRRKQRRLSLAREDLSRTLQREPTPAETARAVGIELETLHRWEAKTADAVQVPLDAPLDSDKGRGATHADILVGSTGAEVEDHINHAQEVERMKSALQRLPERERLVLTLYYYEELKLHEIAEVLDLTESRISQIRSKALKSLRAELAPLRDV
ncbi:MAG TPA: FliA/WhiG family RNA polymerase sigma factor [Thermodesulfobacteriota bacterium]